MVRFLFSVSLLALWISSHAQEKIIKQQTIHKFEPDTVLYQVNEYPTLYGVLALFKPNEIIMSRKLDPAVSQNIVDFRIQVLDSSHLVLKYFKYKASIQIGNALLKHNIFPRGLNAAQVSGLRYFESPDHTKDLLEVQLYGEEFRPSQKIVHKARSESIPYYAVDGKIVNREDLNLTLGNFEFGNKLCCKEAAEKYGDPKYAVGVQEIILKKKP